MQIHPNEMSLLFSMREVFSRAREMSLYTPVTGKGLLATIGEGVDLGPWDQEEVWSLRLRC